MSMYDEPIVFRASVLFDDGDCPVAAEGDTFESTDAAAVRQWALEAVERVEVVSPASAGGYWYATLERGHYERTGDTGFDDVDCDWVHDESFDTVRGGRASARPPA